MARSADINEFLTSEVLNRVYDADGKFLYVGDFDLMVAEGLIAGITGGNKYGRNIGINSGVTADIWDGGSTGGDSLIWLAPTVPAIHNIVSTSASDDGDPVGVGARTIRVIGLKTWDTAESSEIITMNGQTDVPTSDSYVIIYRMQVITSGGTSINVGDITATALAPSNTTVTARVLAGKGQTHMAILGVPSTQTLYMKDLWSSANKSGGASALADITLWFNPNPDVQTINYISKHTAGLQTTGTSQAPHPFTVPKKFVGPGILKMEAVSGSNNMDISAGFDYTLVDN